MKKSLYQRPNKPTRLTVNRRDGAPSRVLQAPLEVLTLDKATECHVTPLDVAERMVDCLGASTDQLTLEPSAGTGNLIAVLLGSGHSGLELTMIERAASLCSALRTRFTSKNISDPINECFLEYAERAIGQIAFSRVIMNPPFRTVHKHIAAALNVLGNAGHDDSVLVALVPITFEHPEAELIEQLPSDTFCLAKVNTKIIRICR